MWLLGQGMGKQLVPLPSGAGRGAPIGSLCCLVYAHHWVQQQCIKSAVHTFLLLLLQAGLPDQDTVTIPIISVSSRNAFDDVYWEKWGEKELAHLHREYLRRHERGLPLDQVGGSVQWWGGRDMHSVVHGSARLC